MDEETIGLFGVLLIVTVLVVSQTGLRPSYAAPSLGGVKWEAVFSPFGCDQQSADSCTETDNQ